MIMWRVTLRILWSSWGWDLCEKNNRVTLKSRVLLSLNGETEFSGKESLASLDDQLKIVVADLHAPIVPGDEQETWDCHRWRFRSQPIDTDRLCEIDAQGSLQRSNTWYGHVTICCRMSVDVSGIPIEPNRSLMVLIPPPVIPYSRLQNYKESLRRFFSATPKTPDDSLLAHHAILLWISGS